MDILSNMLSLINMGYKDRKLIVRVKRSKFCIQILKLFYKEGLIRGFSFSTDNPYDLLIFLKYIENKPLLKDFKRISTSGRRVYISSKSLLTKFIFEGIFLISTSQGLILSYDLIKSQSKLKLGGEILFKITF